ncbi:MAG: bifunctional metallophosphatase/5'-nucleotidase [Bacteroidales bacterium]|nr:bifunctional metallophosphatase/5'-nucleotidase [Candidatus Colimorpha onthohippi]
MNPLHYITLIVGIVICDCLMAVQPPCHPHPSDIIILYDNDAHCQIDGYSYMKALRDSAAAYTPNVVVVSCGDFVSGSTMGAYSRGEYPIRVVNAVGYDYTTLGNHEFDYGMQQLHRFSNLLSAQILCCNFKSVTADTTIFAPYSIRTLSGVRIAFIGVATPASIKSSSPQYFTDSTGNIGYTFQHDSLYSIVQHTVNLVKQQGADYVVVLSHLGDCDDSPTSVELIQHTSHINVVLDGHSHSVIQQRYVTNSNGDSTILSSTGTQFDHIGWLHIQHATGHIQTQLIDIPQNEITYNAVADTILKLKSDLSGIFQQEIGYSQATLPIVNSQNERIVRMREAGIGNLIADAYRITLHADVAIINGGAIRAPIHQGSITFNDIYTVLPFNNHTCLALLSGQQLLDLLEAASANAPNADGRFLQVSGLRYTIDTTTPCHIEWDDLSTLKSIHGARRVYDVTIYNATSDSYLPIRPNQLYRVASNSYVLQNMGCGVRLDNLTLIDIPASTDVDILNQYITTNLQHTIPARYATPEQRIILSGDNYQRE